MILNSEFLWTFYHIRTKGNSRTEFHSETYAADEYYRCYYYYFRVTIAVVTTLRRTKSLVKFSAKNSEANHGWPWNVDGKARYGDDATMRRCDDATMRRCDDTILFW